MFSRALLAGVSVAALAATLTPASAQTPSTTLYGGGSTLAAKVYRDLFNCYSSTAEGVYAGSPGNPANVTSPTGRNPGCSSSPNANVAIGYEPVGSGSALKAYTTGTPAMFGSPATTNTIAYLNSNVGLNATPYPEIEFGGSDAFLNTTQYNQAVAIDSGAFQIPTLATPIVLPVGNTQNVALKTADICAIFSGHATKAFTPAQVVVRADSSGTSFIFSEWLSLNCPKADNFNAANGFPSTTPNWNAVYVGGSAAPLVTASGSGGIATTVGATTNAIGYVSPDYVQPVVANNVYPASVNGFTPSIANVTAQVAAVKAPATYSAKTIGSTINARLVSPATKGGYPIVGFTFVDTYKCYTATKAGGAIGTPVKGTELKAALSYIVNASADVKAILNAQGFVDDSASSGLLASLNAAKGPFGASGIQASSCPKT